MNSKQSNHKLKILDFDIENRPLSYGGQDFTFSDITAIAASWINENKVHVWALGEVSTEAANLAIQQGLGTQLGLENQTWEQMPETVLSTAMMSGLFTGAGGVISYYGAFYDDTTQTNVYGATGFNYFNEYFDIYNSVFEYLFNSIFSFLTSSLINNSTIFGSSIL